MRKMTQILLMTKFLVSARLTYNNKILFTYLHMICGQSEKTLIKQCTTSLAHVDTSHYQSVCFNKILHD